MIAGSPPVSSSESPSLVLLESGSVGLLEVLLDELSVPSVELSVGGVVVDVSLSVPESVPVVESALPP